MHEFFTKDLQFESTGYIFGKVRKTHRGQLTELLTTLQFPVRLMLLCYCYQLKKWNYQLNCSSRYLECFPSINFVKDCSEFAQVQIHRHLRPQYLHQLQILIFNPQLTSYLPFREQAQAHRTQMHRCRQQIWIRFDFQSLSIHAPKSKQDPTLG